MVPTLIGDLSGCLFRNRCDRAEPNCADRDVPLAAAGPEHRYRCLIGVTELRGAARTAEAGS
jgi:peptide/nickel transport system ATP-binding protein